MRYSISLFVCLLFSLFVNAQEQPKNGDTKSPAIFKSVEKMPKPDFNLAEYLSKNIHYPNKARRKRITGRVLIRFIVTETGAIENVTVFKGIGGGCDEEAVRVIKNMPPWIPGTQDGKPVKVIFTQPINFNLTD